MTLHHGIRPNLGQFLHQLLQVLLVLLVGLTLGLMRTVVPAWAEAEFGVPKTSFLLLTTFVLAFGVVKGLMNFFAGRLSDHIGRHRPNVWGMVLCGTGVALIALGHGQVGSVASAALAGFGMALLYPNLSAAVADIAPRLKPKLAPVRASTNPLETP